MNKLILIVIIVALGSCKSKEEKKDAAEEAGQFLTEEKSRLIKGIGEGLKGDGKDAAETVSEGVGEVIKGIGEGFDESMTKIEVKLDDGLKEHIELGRTGKFYNDSSRNTDVTIYTIYNKDFEGKLLLKAFDKEDKELGRKTAEVNKKSDEADFIDFQFDERTPLTLAEYYTLEWKK